MLPTQVDSLAAQKKKKKRAPPKRQQQQQQQQQQQPPKPMDPTEAFVRFVPLSDDEAAPAAFDGWTNEEEHEVLDDAERSEPDEYDSHSTTLVSAVSEDAASDDDAPMTNIARSKGEERHERRLQRAMLWHGPRIERDDESFIF